ERGGFYGWPYAYIGPHADPNHKGAAPEMVKKTLYPSVLLGAHVAALDFIFYTGTAFPKKYRGGCFVALHGSWNRSKLSGYKISFIPFENGKPLAGPEDFLTGWLLSADEHRAWGRPVGILQMPDGSMLVSDDGGGRIWRVSYVTP
ncbi:MAG: PQQ-dependent sugar dehydrogenase, partial [Gammaproteobacteria bacterium]